MTKRAAIYIRVSSEMQAEKASPVEQERDCRAYAEAKGYRVVEVYRDVERYRVKGRLVEPSGTRTERPGLLRMLADAERGVFDVAIAWREDRLYRGLRAMLNVLDLVEAGKLDIELVKENFDRRMAPIKASIAKMELEGIRERTTMGMQSRLRAGKPFGGERRYGYAREGDEVVIHPTEAAWVRQVFEWFTTGVGVREITRRLISQGAPPKEGQIRTKPWHMSTVYRMLKFPGYATGLQEVRWGGQVFQLPVPIIVDGGQWEATQARLRANHNDRAHNVKWRYLLRGLVTCPCGARWNAYSRDRIAYWTKKSTGERLSYPAKFSVYRCARVTATPSPITHPDCPRTKGVVGLERYVWGKVSEVLRQPKVLMEAAEAKRRELQAHHAEASKRRVALEAKLEDLRQERQAYVRKFGIDSAKGGPFTEADLDAVLERLTTEEAEAKRELAEVKVLSDSRIAELKPLVATYMADISSGLHWLDRDPENEQDAAEQFAERRRVVELLVESVMLRKGHDPEIRLRFDLSPVVHFSSHAT